MKNEEVMSENVKAPVRLSKPEHGADSQLHCYNVASWRLAEMFGDEELEPSLPKSRKGAVTG